MIRSGFMRSSDANRADAGLGGPLCTPMTNPTLAPGEPHHQDDQADQVAPIDEPAPRSRRRRTMAIGAIVLATLLVIVTSLALMVGLGVRTDAEAGRVAVSQGRRALASGELDRALERFREAESRFAAGRDRASSGLGGVLSALPVVGRTFDVATGVSQAGGMLAGAAAELTESIESLPNGLGSLAPANGRLPIDTLEELTDEIAAAAAAGRTALETVMATPTSLIPAVVYDARFQAEEQVALASRALDSASLLIEGLPSFAGADGPRQYLLLAESPSEQRGTGGIWGAYAILTADDGALAVGAFDPILTLPEARPDEVPAPNPDYRRNWDAYGGAGSWRDMNMTPDFPSAARAALATYELGTGEALDGVIVADPFAVEEMLKVTGPAEISSLDITLNAHSVVDFMANEAYILYPEAAKDRKGVLGRLVGFAFARFLAARGEGPAKVEAIADAVTGSHLKVYSTDPTVQQGLASAGLDGALSAPEGSDLLAVHVNSRSASKIDYYASRSISYEVELGGQGEAFATTEIEIRNDSPTSGVPKYVIGPGPGIVGHVPGDNVSIVTASCPGPCELIEAKRNGQNQAMRVGEELGRPRYQDFFTTPGGDSSTLRIVTKRDDVWTGNSSGGAYRLTVLPQTTIVPTELEVTIRPPAGTKVVWTSEPMRAHQGAVVWQASPAGRVELVVRFRAPAPLRWLRNVTRPFE